MSSVNVGIYKFLLRFPSDYEFGMTHAGSDSRRIEKAAGAVADHLNKRYALLHDRNYGGFLSAEKYGVHLRQTIKLWGTRADSWISREQLIEKVFKSSAMAPLDALMEITNIFRQTVSDTSPLYIGMTFSQSFRTRLRQHLDGRTGFSESLKRRNLSWSDVTFNTMIMEPKDRIDIRWLEKSVQELLQPSLSDS